MNLSPEVFHSILPASAEDSTCLPFGHMSTQFCTSVKIMGGLLPDTEWELLPKHFNNWRGYGLAFDFSTAIKEKQNFLLSGR